MPHFYQTLSSDRADAIIASQIVRTGNELSNCWLSLSGERVSGVLCAYPASAQQDLQRDGLHQIARSLTPEELPVFFAHLGGLREQVPPVDERGLYLARFAVDESVRGTNLASDLLRRLIDEAGDDGMSLHVRADNERAIAFYRKHGFAITDAGGTDYRVMERR
jgi:ribosomal protein S18 acetylase RimI-like enzyme